MPDVKPCFGTQLKLLLKLPIWMLRPDPRTKQYLAQSDFSDSQHISLDTDSAEWRSSHENQGKSFEQVLGQGNQVLLASKSKPLNNSTLK